MTYNDIPIASAQFLDDESSEKREEGFAVVQARVAEEFDTTSEPAIAVAASDVTVDSELSPNAEEPKPSPPTITEHPDIAAFKEKRKSDQKVALLVGFVVGCTICGPILGAIGAGVAYRIVKKRGRAQQARMEEELNEEGKLNIPVSAVQSSMMSEK